MRTTQVHQYSLGFLILCTLVALRAPVAYLPILRTPSLVYETETEPTQIPNLSAMSKARVYADINVLRPKEYWDYESLTVQWG
jgi:casein kinase II subunit alpha